MKLFNTFQELWNYCETCPICKGIREIEIIIDSLNKNISIDTYYKTHQQLELSVRIKYSHIRSSEAYYIVINCIDNTFRCNAAPYLLDNEDFIYFNAQCIKCLSSWVCTDDLIFDNKSAKILNLSIDKEDVMLNNNGRGYYLTYDYMANSTAISTIVDIQNNTYNKKAHVKYKLDREDVKLPIIIPLNFNDSCDTLVNKIDILLLFS